MEPVWDGILIDVFFQKLNTFINYDVIKINKHSS